MCCGGFSYLDNESTLGCLEEERFEPKLSTLPLFSMFSCLKVSRQTAVCAGGRRILWRMCLNPPSEYRKSPHTKGSCHLFPAASQSLSQGGECPTWRPLPAASGIDPVPCYLQVPLSVLLKTSWVHIITLYIYGRSKSSQFHEIQWMQHLYDFLLSSLHSNIRGWMYFIILCFLPIFLRKHLIKMNSDH